MNKELLPCPFCGSAAEVYNASCRNPHDPTMIDVHWIADCTKCDCNIEFNQTEVDAITAWNTRPQPQPIDVGAIKREVADNIGCTIGDLTLHDAIDHLASRGYLRAPVVLTPNTYPYDTSKYIVLPPVNRKDVADFNPINFTNKEQNHE